MASGPDFTVYSPDGRAQMAVEAKYRPGASDEWAAQFRRNLLRHSILPRTHYFLLVLPEHSYLWPEAERHEDAPGVKIRTEELLHSFFQANPTRPASEDGLELAVGGWLHMITRLPRHEVERRHGWLVEAGVYDQIRDGYVEYPSAA